MGKDRVHFGPKWCLISLLCIGAIPSTFAQNQSENRILQAMDPSQMVPLRGSVQPKARLQHDQGRVSSDMQLHGVSLVFSLSEAQRQDLDQLLEAQRDPASPNYRKWLTPDQYADRFGMSQNDLDQVSSWLQTQGFTGIRVSRSRNQIAFDGSVAQLESAFRMEMHQYLANGETHFANASAPLVPATLANVTLGMRGLDDFRLKPRSRRIVPHFTSSQSGNHFLSPGDVATIYDIDPLYTAGFDGTGVSIAVAGQTLIDLSDANAFRSAAGLSVNPPQLLLVPNTGISATFSSDLDEANLDVEWSGGVAKNATVIFVYAGNDPNSGVFDALQYAIDQDIAPVISISYGLCEADFNSGNPQSAQIVQGWVQQANSQGQTLTSASGDSGAADCDGDASTPATVAIKGLSVDVPASIPEVTGVGGTEFSADITNASTYWNPASGSDLISSAIKYIPEMAWNDSPVTGTGPTLSTSLFAAGGGVSTVFSKPSWQTALTPNDGARDVPDVSLAGSPNHDGYLVCSQGSCVNGFRLASGNLNVFGGTSVGSQVMGGILAIINQATNSGGLGNANVELYKLAGTTPAAFNDVTSGNNIVPCTPGTPTTGSASLRCPSSGTAQIGYSAKTGYDLATGLGSLNVDTLARAWMGFSATPPFTVSANPAAITVGSAGQSGNSTISVTSAAAVNLTCAFVPPQPAAAGLSCSFDKTSITSSDSATLTVGTTAAHAVSTTSASNRWQGGWLTLSGGGFLACFFVAGIPARRWRWAVLLALISIGSLALSVGCGGGSNGGGGGGGGTQTAATPILSPAPGTFTGHVTVSFSDGTSGANILCTTDGTTPTSSSSACTTFDFTSTTTVKAIAVATGFNNSAVASGTYTIQSGTAAGAYVVRVTAKSGSTTETTDVPVTVQ